MGLDPRFDKRRFSISDIGDCDLSIFFLPFSRSSMIAGVVLLQDLKWRVRTLVVRTAIKLDDSMFTVHKISDAYEGIQFTSHG